ncbi:MAG TPA: hypothetical protein VHX17_04530 [Candidatus Cybelea sp.]|jgi:hypothetical protein|nr:hypothetical protein [Candidatus Cybelea sp.]
MLFGSKREDREGAIAVVRDVVEIVAILAAGAWAFYVFAFENRIKPSWANPQVNFAASLQRLGERHGLIALRLHQRLHNFGTVPAHFLGLAIDVYGERVSPTNARQVPPPSSTTYNYKAFFATTREDPVYSLAYVTSLGDAASTQVTKLDPGDTLENDYTFYVPRNRYDLLTVEISGIFTKYEGSLIPTRIVRSPQGAAKLETSDLAKATLADTNPVTSLNL